MGNRCCASTPLRGGVAPRAAVVTKKAVLRVLWRGVPPGHMVHCRYSVCQDQHPGWPGGGHGSSGATRCWLPSVLGVAAYETRPGNRRPGLTAAGAQPRGVGGEYCQPEPRRVPTPDVLGSAWPPQGRPAIYSSLPLAGGCEGKTLAPNNGGLSLAAGPLAFSATVGRIAVGKSTQESADDVTSGGSSTHGTMVPGKW